MSKGAIGIEFVVSIVLFLSAFWFIYLQSALMLTPQLQRADIREMGVEFYSNMLISDTVEGYAEAAGVLNKTLLNNDNGLNCSDIQSDYVAGMEFAWRVTSSVGTWKCKSSIAKEGVIKRPVYVHIGGWAYKPAVMEVWAV